MSLNRTVIVSENTRYYGNVQRQTILEVERKEGIYYVGSFLEEKQTTAAIKY